MEELSERNKTPFKDFDDFKNKKYGQDYADFDAQTASTFTQAIQQIQEDKYYVITGIIINNSTSTILTMGMIQDQKNFIVSHMAELLHKFGEENFIIWYNKKNEFRFFLTKFCRNQFIRKKGNPSKFIKENVPHNGGVFECKKYAIEEEEFKELQDTSIEEPIDEEDEFHNVELSQIYNWTIKSINVFIERKQVTRQQAEYFIKYLDYVTHKQTTPKTPPLTKVAKQINEDQKKFSFAVIKIKKLLKKEIKNQS